MQDEEHQADTENDVKQSSSNVKCEKTKQPKNQQDHGNYSKHG